MAAPDHEKARARQAFIDLVEVNPGAVFTKGENVRGYRDLTPAEAEAMDRRHAAMVCEVCGWDLTKHSGSQDEGLPPRRVGRIRGVQGGDVYCPYEDAPTT